MCVCQGSIRNTFEGRLYNKYITIVYELYNNRLGHYTEYRLLTMSWALCGILLRTQSLRYFLCKGTMEEEEDVVHMYACMSRQYTEYFREHRASDSALCAQVSLWVQF